MSPQELFESICRALADPAAYPHPVSGLKRVDTHISSVFLTGRWVYKLKKPVDLGFLDFTTLNKRRRFCGAEVGLNQRLARDIYLEVTPIFEDGGGRFSLTGNGRIVEYAVKMKQLPDQASLEELLKKDKVRQWHIENLGRVLVDFYLRAEQGPGIDRFGRKKVISNNIEENFQQLEPFVGTVLEPEKWEFICEVSRSFLEHHHDLFQHRLMAGRIRDGHGDLRAEHVYFYKGVKIIDCIEFNDRFRYGDVILDMAFLHMDIEHLGHPRWSRALLAEYVDRADDLQAYTLLDFYAAYRSVVRLKVSCLRSLEAGPEEVKALTDEARIYLEQAYRYAIQFSRPSLWIFCGLPATGKSSIARRVAEALSLPYLQSDRIRKAGAPWPGREVVDFGQGSYSLERRAHVYSLMLGQAQELLKKGQSVILDASFSRRKWREEAGLLAEDLDTNLIVVECVCRDETIKARLKGRENAPTISDARLQNFQQIQENFEPVTELSGEIHLTANTDRPLRETVLNILSRGYGLKCEQVAYRLAKC